MEQREIKFRAWNGNKMCNDCIFVRPQFCNALAILYDEKYAIESLSVTEWKVMQFTGVKDKNGVDIYEGDIVKWIHDKFDIDKPFREEKYTATEISYVEYVGHGFWLKDESFGWEGEDLWDWKQIEVIGNIFENKDLLETKV